MHIKNSICCLNSDETKYLKLRKIKAFYPSEIAFEIMNNLKCKFSITLVYLRLLT